MSDKYLSSREALEETVALRSSSNQNLRNLKKALSVQVDGKSCLVLGSAPGAVLPLPAEFERCFCVNGSPFIACRNDINVDLTLIVGFTTAMRKKISAMSMDKLRDLHTNHLAFVSVGDDYEHAIEVLAEKRFTFDIFSSITPVERAVIIGSICEQELGLGAQDERISNGVFTVLLALWGGASKVIVSGMSLAGGHDYAKDTPRRHLAGDTRCLHLLSRKYPQVKTTSIKLHEAVGLPLV